MGLFKIRPLEWRRTQCHEFARQYEAGTPFGYLYVQKFREEETDPWPRFWTVGWSFSEYYDEGLIVECPKLSLAKTYAFDWWVARIEPALKKV